MFFYFIAPPPVSLRDGLCAWRKNCYLCAVKPKTAVMELKEFISKVLIDIAEGAKEADRHLSTVGGLVNPRDQGHEGRTNFKPCEVSFSIAVTESESRTKGSGLSVVFGSVGLGRTGKESKSGDTVSRLDFTIRVILPPPSDDRAGK